jgi:hypothetical protein
MKTFKNKRLILVLVGSLLTVASSAQAFNYFTTGDMETATASTLPDGWFLGGTQRAGTAVSSPDTPDGSNWSIKVDSDEEVYFPYAKVESICCGTFTGTEDLLLAFDYKGDIYTWQGITDLAVGGGSEWAQIDDWRHYSKWVTPDAGTHTFKVDGFSDSSPAGGRSAYFDNLYLGDDYIKQDFSLVTNGDVETWSDGAYWYFPDGGPSNDVPVPGGTWSMEVGVDGALRSPELTLDGGQQYEVAFWHKGEVDVHAKYTDRSVPFSVPNSGGWAMSSFTMTVDAVPGGDVEVWFNDVVAGGDSVVIDNLSVVKSISGDFDHNGLVDGADFLHWQRGLSSSPLSQTDLDDWHANYGLPAIAAAATAVPEPASAGLLVGAMGLLALVGRRRK